MCLTPFSLARSWVGTRLSGAQSPDAREMCETRGLDKQRHLPRTRHAAPFALALLVVWTAGTASFSLPPPKLSDQLAALVGNRSLTKKELNLLEVVDTLLRSKEATINEVIKSKDEAIKMTNDLIKSKDDVIKSKDDVIKSKDAAIKRTDDLLQAKEMEILRAKGLLSSRGIFEWTLRLAAKECRPKDKFNATSTIRALRLKNPRRWEKILIDGVQTCFQNTRVTSTLEGIYGTLSDEIHGFPWVVNAVQLSDQLSKQAGGESKFSLSMSTEVFFCDRNPTVIVIVYAEYLGALIPFLVSI
ncbi:hypothetical protein AK812_SmicGene4728 [Symbiodinium microadriaticum]|uniref:Uncharacterized protein n=1 Tax=Symbiodinium microadriaticum TaxID=2951 RepID=A0A1Q9EVG9_SYMMI|nr:hypothetical protein AK812_SmicGene4728 [Symbiodinium microadriaticum]